MEYKLSIYFSNNKDLTIILKDDEFNRLLDNMLASKAHWNEDKKSGFSVPLFNVMYYTFVEYTEEMKQADAERVKQAKENKEELAKEIKE